MTEDKMKWFREARYGLFIHWGLYALPAGEWNGEQIYHGGEWIMKNARIPYAEYSKLADEFNPRLFDADEYVRLASQVFGFKYLCFTAKHHDGFAMYDSTCSSYNVMNTPYGKDIVRALAAACEKYNMIFCLYYSQLQDWAEPDGFGNTWDFGPEERKNFRSYLDNKVKPQLKELLSEYGKVSMLWFDTPYEMDKGQCAELAEFVRSIQPDCLINGRIGYNLGDYRQMSDRSIPLTSYEKDWEVPMTLNDTWGFRTEDKNWKDEGTVIRMLTDVVGKGGNLLLNIGPDREGRIPKGSLTVLEKVGAWLKKNGNSIYGTDPVPDFPYELEFGRFTYRKKEKKLYMHVLNYPKKPYEILVTGLITGVKSARLLASGRELKCWQTYETARDEHRFRVIMPETPPDEIDTVVELELEGDVETQRL